MKRNSMRLIAPLLLLLMMFVGAASATDYYVSTTGSNGASGNITHPWQNVSYATQQAVAGDTIYLFDGIWYNEHAVFANSGNATHPITLTAYNGTPTLDGVDKTGKGVNLNYKDHLKVSHLTIRRYYQTICHPGDYIHISDCDLSDTGDVVIVISQYNSTRNTIENCTLYDSGWNTIQVSANREPPNGNGIPATYITVRNCTIYNSTKHAAIDLFGNFQNVTIEENELYSNPAGCIFSHDIPDHQEYVTIRDNYFHDTQSDGMQLGISSYYEIYNNTFKNITGGNYPIYLSENSHDYEIYNNSFYNCMSPRTSSGYNFVFDRNYIHTDSGAYMFTYGANGTVRNPLGKKSLDVKFYNAMADMEFDDGTVFTATFGGASEYTPVRYYPDKSNCSITALGVGQHTLSATTYNVTLTPTNSYLKDVTINHESDAADDRTNISANSSVSSNPTTITATMQNSSHTYNVSVDGVYTTQVVSNAAKVATYQYSSSWSTHTFEFDWFSDAGFSGAPDPTNIANTTGETWVRHSWSAGSGNITDSYNVSVDSAWHNTTNAYHNNTGLAAETWSNVTVWAFNNTGGSSQNSISQSTQSDAATWAPSNTAMYYNVSSVITITTKTDGTNLFSRTPTEADGNATSGRIVVKTS